MQEARAQVHAEVPARPWAWCAGKIGHKCAHKSAREDNMWLCAFGPHAVGLVEMWVPFHVLRVWVHAGHRHDGHFLLFDACLLLGLVHHSSTFTSAIRVFFLDVGQAVQTHV